jgi:LmbE family N-acetylglucosaminyl deacetylase
VKILLSPHDDDNALFAAFTCIREKPIVVVCLDSYIQPNRGERGCSAAERAAETAAAAKVLCVQVYRLGFSDAEANGQLMFEAFRRSPFNDESIDTVYAPAEHEGGNVHHNLVAMVARLAFSKRVVAYPTYTRTNLYMTGDIEVIPDERELGLKHAALAHYTSQLRINRPHFDAVLGKSEWLNR